MDGCAGKRSVDRFVVPRKASGLVLRENMNKKDGKTAPFCSRIGCNAKVTSSTKRTRIGSLDNNTKVGQLPVPSSSNGKEIIGSSSRTPVGFGYLRKPTKVTAKRLPSSNLDTESSETSTVHDDPAAAEATLPRPKTKRCTTNVHSQSAVSGEVGMTKAGSSSRGRSSHQKSELGTRDTLTGLCVSSPSSNSEHTVRGGLSKNRLRSLSCNSVSDVLPSNSSSGTKISVSQKKKSGGESSSSSKDNKTNVLVPKVRNQNSSHGNGIRVSENVLSCDSVSNVLPSNSSSATKISVAKKKKSGGESSSSKGNKTNVLVPKVRNQNSSHGSGIVVSDNRRNRIVPSIRDNSVVSSSGRRSERLEAVASSATSRQTPFPATPTDPNPSFSLSPSNRYSRPNSSTGSLRRMMPGSPSEADRSHSLVNQDGLSHYNMNGIAEVLLALERIEHDEELTYEQLASLETNLFSSSMFRFYDQHRDMRLDIDNMSYEELLALGDKMGTVSTALSEEALSRSLKQSIYQGTDETGAISLVKDDDIKCSICQEEYVDGDEVGTMPCQHMYHVSCVQQWLRMKNWCPICKTSAEEEKSV
ncbi:PREDICTED: probable E3 ubiquitin-protein ligase RHG1A [Camelina sativa]|uniref:RING-type E3 ubiquitin transferase n=1 Tax=Camelina sativa TaxID=90675 RepID=A0ABM0T9B0_CAMSA|nr:PREDICTED: probable E3 ubiquitin-protein ligase RHG1A [Camelina sativa]